MALTDKLTAIADAIRAKTGGVARLTLAEMAAEIGRIETGSQQTGSQQTDYTFNQVNSDVEAFLENVAYDPADYSNSAIADYVKDTTHHRPEGAVVAVPEAGVLSFVDSGRAFSTQAAAGTVTVYNAVPGSAAPYTVTKSDGTIIKYGVLKPSGALRMIYLNDAKNVRDLGGWTCDGGTVEYGKLFRGSRLFIDYCDGNTNVINEYDVNVLHNLLGIRHELDLRYSHEVERDYSLIGKDVDYTHIDGAWYAISDEIKCKSILGAVMDSVINGIPLYFHCAGGADRTGTLAMFLEALLGVSQSDIDKDYELTSFFSGVATDAQARRRNESDWQGLITAFGDYPGNTIRDKVFAWVITLGIPAATVNAFRAAMIDGTPEALVNPYGTVAVTKNLTHISMDNSAAVAEMYRPYTATLSADTGYSLVGASVIIAMGGTDITENCYQNGVISIEQVTGALTITASATAKYTNQILHGTDTVGGTALYNGSGYKQGYRWTSTNTEDGTAISGMPNKFAVGYIKVEPGDVVHLYGDIWKGTLGAISMHIRNAEDTTTLVRSTPNNWYKGYKDRSDIMQYMTDIDYDETTYTLHSFKWTGGTNAVTGYMHWSFIGVFDETTTVLTINEEM